MSERSELYFKPECEEIHLIYIVLFNAIVLNKSVCRIVSEQSVYRVFRFMTVAVDDGVE